jgi:NAD(P)-dependent dehydrogenase (short-subunit alcohol dehydrogenase family)
VITGATSGIGLEASKQLAERGARLVLACRNLQKAEPVAEELRRIGASSVEVVHLDLASLDSVRRCAAELTTPSEPIDVLINNAGVFAMSRQETTDGFELTFGVNHLGPFLLTNLLIPALRRAEHARIVNVASAAYRYAKLNLEDLQRERWRGSFGWGGFQAYGASRLATVLFTRELAARIAADGITANSCHPGHVETNIFPVAPGLMGKVMSFTSRYRISAAEGARPVVRLATDDELEGVTGEYFNRFKREDIASRAADPELARGLWEKSAELTGLSG